MSDHYSEIVNTGLGNKIAKNLGLPTPAKLERYEAGKPVLTGEVAFGMASGDDLRVASAVWEGLSKHNANVSTDATLPNPTGALTVSSLTKKLENDSTRFKVAIFDASNIKSSDELAQVYEFFKPIVKKLKSSGRVIILTRPECCFGDEVGFAMAQTAMTGFVKSLAKEVKKGITVNQLAIKKGLEHQLLGTLEFFMSAKSAYVSGQVVVLNHDNSVMGVDADKPLKNKKILVTGAARGIGAAIAEVVVEQGASVICLDVPSALADLQKVASRLGAEVLPMDITVADAGEQIAKACGQLDGIVHNAGVTRDKTLANMDKEKWELVLNINLKAIANINDYLLKNNGLADDAHLVCLSSIAGIAGNFGQTNYAMSKAGVIGLTRATAKAFKGTNRTINAVAPGFIETQMTAAIPFAVREAGRRMNAASQGGLPVDVAQTIAWLLSPNSSAVNGNVVRVCGLSVLGA